MPIGGCLVVFLPGDIPHEVLPATRDRLSLTGWFRRRGNELFWRWKRSWSAAACSGIACVTTAVPAGRSINFSSGSTKVGSCRCARKSPAAPPTPRAAAEIPGGQGGQVLDGQAAVITTDGEDVSAQFLSGAYQALERGA